MDPTCATPDEDYRVALIQWKTIGMVVESGQWLYKSNSDKDRRVPGIVLFNQCSKIPRERRPEWWAAAMM